MGKRVVTISSSKKKEVPWEIVLKEFLLIKQAQGKSATTINDYQRHVNYFFKRYPDAWQSSTLKKSIIEYMADEIKPATYNLRWVYLKAFFQWAVDEAYIDENPLDGFKKRKTQGRIVDIPEDILTKLLKLPNIKTFAGLRDYSLIVFTLDTGARPKEALSLTVQDFDLKRMIVTVPADVSKTRISRTLPLLQPTVDAVTLLIKVRHSSWNANTPVFCSNEGTSLNKDTWGDRLELYSKQLNFKIRPYDLRHSFALLYLRSGGNVFGLQKELGHVDMSMTRRYVNLSGNDLQEIHKNASPLNRLMNNKNRVVKIKNNK